MADDGKRREIYKWIRMGGLLSLIPFLLAAGPFLGYATFNYLRSKFDAPVYLLYIFVTVGFIASVKETIRIIRITLRSK